MNDPTRCGTMDRTLLDHANLSHARRVLGDVHGASADNRTTGCAGT